MTLLAKADGNNGGNKMKRDYRDITAGALILLFGALFAAYAVVNYELGSVRRLGPGAFPMGVGVILIGLGALIALPALFRSGSFTRIAMRPSIAVLAGLIAFAVTVRPLGLLPAIAALVVLSSYGERQPNLKAIAGVCVVLSALVYGVFSVALGLPFTMLKWPF